MTNGIIRGRLLAALALGLLLSAPGFAEKPEWADKDQGKDKYEQRDKGSRARTETKSQSREVQRDRSSSKRDDQRDDRRDSQRDDRRYDSRERSGSYQFRDHDHDRVVIQNYYRKTYSSKRCPPGLSKKGNSCMPSGVTRKWSRGRPLPRDVIFYDLPPAIVLEIGAPPAGHRYVRVAADILLIAVGTGMVVDAIEDLRW